MPSTFDPTQVAIAGVNLLFLIIGFIEFIKGFFPDAPGRLWLALAFLFGVIGQGVAYVQANGVPATLDDGAAVVVLGLLTGLAAAKAYDESIGKRPYRRTPRLAAAPIYQSMTPLVQGADGALYDTSTPRGSVYDFNAALAAGAATLTKTTTATVPLEPDKDEYDLSGIMDDLDESDGARGPA